MYINCLVALFNSQTIHKDWPTEGVSLFTGLDYWNDLSPSNVVRIALNQFENSV